MLPSSLPSELPSNQPSGSPSSMPTLTMNPSSNPSFSPFDITDCASYSNKWLLDLRESCDSDNQGNLFNCRCADAERRISNGQIDCDIDKCPEDCVVCQQCLYDVVDCFSHAPSSVPSGSPSVAATSMPSMLPSLLPSTSPSHLPTGRPSIDPSSQPSVSPTSVPTTAPTSVPSVLPSVQPSLSPSSDPSANPSLAPSAAPSVLPSSSPSISPFNITDCASYSETWREDLDSSCVELDSGELINCQCADAERRIFHGQIDCTTPSCPEDCSVCEFCLYYVVDCHSHVPSSSPTVAPSYSPSGSVGSIIEPSYSPSIAGTFLPTFIPLNNPSIVTSSDPTADAITNVPSSLPSLSSFDIADCVSYSSLWSFDLFVSCDQNENGEYINCQCPEAELRISTGQIDCDVDECPFGCEVCNFCLTYVVDCYSPAPS